MAAISSETETETHALLMLLCGLPGAGKTTLANHLCQTLSSETQQNGQLMCKIIPHFDVKQCKLCCHHICYDSYLFKQLHETKDNDGNIQFDSQLWKQSRDHAYTETQSLIDEHLHNNEQSSSSTSYLLLVVDDNMYYRSMRYKYYKLAKHRQIGFLIVYMDTDKEECIRRNNQRKGLENVDKSVIHRMSENFQPPTSNKYSWEFHNCFTFSCKQDEHLKLNADNNLGVDSLYATLYHSWSRIPVLTATIDAKQQALTRQANAKSLKHQTDLKLRKAMSRWMNLLKQRKCDQHAGKEISVISKKIVNFRKDILQDVTKCVIEDEEELNIMIEAFEQQFSEMINQYLILLGINVGEMNTEHTERTEQQEEKKDNK